MELGRKSLSKFKQNIKYIINNYDFKLPYERALLHAYSPIDEF